VAASLVALLAVIIAGGGYIAWGWSQGQYYVATDGKGEVVIYRGINQRVAGISLSSPYQRTGIPLAQVPANYQQTLRASVAAANLGDAQEIVANVRSAVSTCKQQYAALASWVKADHSYQAAVALATREHKPTKNIPTPGPEPARAGVTCPPSAAFGISASALVPPAPGSS
jgi:protein phosphatase